MWTETHLGGKEGQSKCWHAVLSDTMSHRSTQPGCQDDSLMYICMRKSVRSATSGQPVHVDRPDSLCTQASKPLSVVRAHGQAMRLQGCLLKQRDAMKHSLLLSCSTNILQARSARCKLQLEETADELSFQEVLLLLLWLILLTSRLAVLLLRRHVVRSASWC